MNLTRQDQSMQSFLLAALLFLAVVIGVLASSRTGWLVLAALAVSFVLVGSLWAGVRFVDRSGWLIVLSWFVVVWANCIQNIVGIPVGYVIEFVLFGLSVGVMRRVWRDSSKEGVLRVVIVLWVFYCTLGVISVAFGRARVPSALWQLQYNMKWPLMLCLGLLVEWGERHIIWLRRLCVVTISVLGAIIATEIVLPGVHETVFGPVPDMHQNPILGWGLRFRGPFMHSGYLAILCAILSCVCIAFSFAGAPKFWRAMAGLYALLLLLSGQRQELFCLLVALLLIAVVRGRRYWYLIAPVFVILCVAGGVVLFLSRGDAIREVGLQWGLVDGVGVLSERAVLSYGGVAVANSFFPLGSGLGTYGGVGALKFDQDLYVEMGFLRYWWFRKGLFLVDTFWPNVLAESGYIGGLLLFGCLLVLWVGLLRKAWCQCGGPNAVLALAGFSCLTILILNSPTSAVLTDPRGAILAWLLIGAGWRGYANEPGGSAFR